MRVRQRSAACRWWHWYSPSRTALHSSASKHSRPRNHRYTRSRHRNPSNLDRCQRTRLPQCRGCRWHNPQHSWKSFRQQHRYRRHSRDWRPGLLDPRRVGLDSHRVGLDPHRVGLDPRRARGPAERRSSRSRKRGGHRNQRLNCRSASRRADQ
jgi:hypothetical protein